MPFQEPLKNTPFSNFTYWVRWFGDLALSVVTTSDTISNDIEGITNSSFVINTSFITPSQITSNQNDYNPTGISTAFGLVLTSDASRQITGIAGGETGRELTLFNTGAQDIVLVNNSGSSSAENTFQLPGGANLTLNAGDAVKIIYLPAGYWKALAL